MNISSGLATDDDLVAGPHGIRKTAVAEARIHAHSLRVTKMQRIRAYFMELFPLPHTIRKWTQGYLIFEAFLSIYLLICLVLINSDQATEAPYEHYRNANIFFVFCCLLPFMALRIITLLCCR